tara:strand:+ start:639 stop:1499 length:861 start_codon:yes stop_codon:yes gene_type:complete
MENLTPFYHNYTHPSGYQISSRLHECSVFDHDIQYYITPIKPDENMVLTIISLSEMCADIIEFRSQYSSTTSEDLSSNSDFFSLLSKYGLVTPAYRIITEYEEANLAYGLFYDLLGVVVHKEGLMYPKPNKIRFYQRFGRTMRTKDETEKVFINNFFNNDFLEENIQFWSFLLRGNVSNPISERVFQPTTGPDFQDILRMSVPICYEQDKPTKRYKDLIVQRPIAPASSLLFYALKRNIKDIRICEICKKRFMDNSKVAYQKFCSVGCKMKDYRKREKQRAKNPSE